MVIAYWLIGREIVEEVQGGEQRAEYGMNILPDLSAKLNKKYGKGFSVTSLKYFRTFYQSYSERDPEIGRLAGDQLNCSSKGRPSGDLLIHGENYPTGSELPPSDISSPTGRKLTTEKKVRPMGVELNTGFSPSLNWSQYRALMRIKSINARDFYEKEAVDAGWDKRVLERHIHSQYYERLLQTQNSEAMKQSALTQESVDIPIETLKNPYVLEFLGLPDVSTLHETELEAAIISQLQSFLLELGKGFAFVGQQKHLKFGDKDLFVDLVFYNCILKCYLLIDLKMGELSYQDVGQMDGYVRMFDDLYTADDDNPTIGLILCTEKNEAVARYSVLSERKQIFASKYMLYLPTEEELQQEIERERRLIEANLEQKRLETNYSGDAE